MPIYEYQCTNCGHRVEVLQSFSAPPLASCPECGNATMEKLVNAVGVIFKGSGFYSTDYKKGGDRVVPPKASGKSEGGESGGGPSGDSKPSESSSSESKPSESKGGDSKPSESKPAPAKTESKPAPKADSKTS